MKKILILLGLAAVCFTASSQTSDSYFAGSVTSPGQLATNNGVIGTVVLITTNRANIHSVQVSSASTGVMQLFDCGNTNNPFWGVNSTNAGYWTTASYATNYVTTYISPLTATTNIFTNKGVWTYFVTNAASTNALTPLYASAFTANIATISQPLTQVAAQGIVLFTTTNVNYTIGYTP